MTPAIDSIAFTDDFLHDPIDWRETPRPVPQLALGNIHLWRLDLTRAAESVDVLSADERARAEQFHFPEHRRRFVAGRSALRAILGSYLDILPSEIQFDYNAWGKPSLRSHDLHFNVTHSDDLALIAVRKSRPIGIDVERLDRPFDHLNVARQFFSSNEADELTRLPEQHRPAAFFRMWTAREAMLKLEGIGLAGLERAAVDSLSLHAKSHNFVPATGYIAACAWVKQRPPQSP